MSGPVTRGGPRGGEGAPEALRLRRWSARPVLAVAVMALASGFGQFGVVAALGDVSRQLGHVVAGSSIADKVGLSATSLAAGLAVIRLASLGSLPLVGLADRAGRRVTILAVTVAGLALTTLAALSPGYWWFVAVFALGRPLLSATNALADVMAAEETPASDRSTAVALVAAGYAVGAGASAVLHSLAASSLGFRGIFALAVVPLLAVVLLRHWVEEPSRFEVAEAEAVHPRPVLGAVAPPFRVRLAALCVIAFALSFITGPANSFAFLFAQDVEHQRGVVTAAMVVGAGVVGLGGLLAGRWAADHVGRRATGTVAMVAVAVSAVWTYSGGTAALVTGYVLGILSAAVLAPAVGSLVAELFPTSVRASAAGWWVATGVLGAGAGLVAFGAVADVGNRFALAAAVVFLPAAAFAALFWVLPETKGREPEALWRGVA